MNDPNRKIPELPELTPDEQAEYDALDDMDLDSITPEKIAQATLEGDDFVPQNEAEEYLKKEIKEAGDAGAVIDIQTIS